MANKRKMIGLVFVAFVMLTILLLGLTMHQTGELRTALDLVVKERLLLSSATVTRERVPGFLETDPEGCWELQLAATSPMSSDKLKTAGFRPSDETDNQYFRSLVEQLVGQKLPADFRSFEADFSLGDETICANDSCSVSVLLSETSQKMYVTILKN